MNNSIKRYGYKWTISEILNLQREYELLKLPIPEIAALHKRSVLAIVFKLHKEGFITSWDEIKGVNLDTFYGIETMKEDSDISEDEEDRDDSSDYVDSESDDNDDYTVTKDENMMEDLTNRVWNLETTFSEISQMVKQMFHELVEKKK